MRLKPWLLLGGAIATEVTSSLSLKAAIDQPVWYAAVLIGFVAAFVFLAGALRAGMALGVAYGIWGALGVALTAVFGTVLFGEPLTAVMGVGIALIMGGVVTIELGSHRAARELQEVNA
jgi:small multidrug resistance pump